MRDNDERKLSKVVHESLCITPVKWVLTGKILNQGNQIKPASTADVSVGGRGFEVKKNHGGHAASSHGCGCFSAPSMGSNLAVKVRYTLGSRKC
jgi:hypothetical protein